MHDVNVFCAHAQKRDLVPLTHWLPCVGNIIFKWSRLSAV